MWCFFCVFCYTCYLQCFDFDSQHWGQLSYKKYSSSSPHILPFGFFLGGGLSMNSLMVIVFGLHLNSQQSPEWSVLNHVYSFSLCDFVGFKKVILNREQAGKTK